MRLPDNNFKLVAASLFLSGVLLLSGCPDGTNYSDLRVIHAVKDAPPVNVSLNFKDVLKDLDYAESSGYLSVRSGIKRINVEAIVPGGNLDVIKVNKFRMKSGERYNILAINDTTDIAPLVVEESAAEPDSGEVGIAVVHASNIAGEVDVYVTAADILLINADPSFTFDFTDVVDLGAQPTGIYRIRITGKGSKTAVYDSGPIDLDGFGGEKLLLVALSNTTDTELEASPVKLLAAADAAQLTLLDKDTGFGARVVHLSPDAGPVEVFADSPSLGGEVELIDVFAYTDIVPGADSYGYETAGDYTFTVAPNTGTSGDKVFMSPVVELDAGKEYSVIAAGYTTTTPEFDLWATVDRNRSIITQVSVKVVHGAPAAETVDVYVTPAGVFTAAEVEAGMAGAPLLDGFAYGDISDYLAIPPGSYDIRVVPEASGVAEINVEGIPLDAGTVATVIARQSKDSGLPDDFGLVVLTN